MLNYHFSKTAGDLRESEYRLPEVIGIYKVTYGKNIGDLRESIYKVT